MQRQKADSDEDERIYEREEDDAGAEPMGINMFGQRLVDLLSIISAQPSSANYSEDRVADQLHYLEQILASFCCEEPLVEWEERCKQVMLVGEPLGNAIAPNDEQYSLPYSDRSSSCSIEDVFLIIASCCRIFAC
jgi:hypothetical protein